MGPSNTTRNGLLFYTSLVTPTYPLLVDTSLNTVGAQLTNVVISTGGAGGEATIQWLVTDQLGTPRMIFDKTGSLAAMKRHDYLPFGEEISAWGGRTTAQGYNVPDGTRQQFTQKERDIETGLDFFGERYYSSTMGRFTTVDPLGGSARIANPQTMNRYTFVLNNPLRYVDPDGLKEVPAWTQLTDEQQRILAPKLIKVQNPNKITSTELKRAGGIFNSKATGHNEQATRDNVATVQNLIDTVAGGGKSVGAHEKV